MHRDERAGFTLIELLVVIAILGILYAAFAPDIFGARQNAEKAADQANLRWHYQQITLYQQQYKALPHGSGYQFVLDPWVSNIVQHTPKSFERYWIPGLAINDPRYAELKEEDPETIWKRLDELQSTDTQYAGPSAEARQSRARLIGDGKQPVMSDDNEFGPSFVDKTTNVLMGDGSVYAITRKDVEDKYGYPLDGDEAKCPVGPDSPVPMLQKLEP